MGFGTIVGSAVFNVLFVIGMCALFSKELLELTWWPLFRDCTYYLISLVVLATFFGVDYYGGAEGTYGENFIEWWESLILFVMYLGYVTVMKFNVQLQGAITRCCCKQTPDDDNTKVTPAPRGLVRHSTEKQCEVNMKEKNINASFLRYVTASEENQGSLSFCSFLFFFSRLAVCGPRPHACMVYFLR